MSDEGDPLTSDDDDNAESFDSAFTPIAGGGDGAEKDVETDAADTSDGGGAGKDETATGTTTTTTFRVSCRIEVLTKFRYCDIRSNLALTKKKTSLWSLDL